MIPLSKQSASPPDDDRCSGSGNTTQLGCLVVNLGIIPTSLCQIITLIRDDLVLFFATHQTLREVERC